MHFAENVFSLSDGPKANFSKSLKLYNFNCWIIKSAKKLKFDTKNLSLNQLVLHRRVDWVQSDMEWVEKIDGLYMFFYLVIYFRIYNESIGS